MRRRETAWQKWQSRRSSTQLILLICAFLWLIAAYALLSATRSWMLVILHLLVPILITPVVYRWYKYNQHLMYKYYRAPLPAAIETIQGILDNYAIPYRRPNEPAVWSSPAVLEIEQSNLIIQIITYEKGIGVQVIMFPVVAANRPLAQSLQEKIDEAFTPRGLS